MENIFYINILKMVLFLWFLFFIFVIKNDMSYLGAPKYSKIEIEFRDTTSKKLLNEILNNKNNSMSVFEDCGVMITGNHLLIIEDNAIDIPESIKFTKTSIFPLDEIEYYKIYNY